MSSLSAISRLVREEAGFDRPWVHVAGSKGKGSTVFLAAHLLKGAGRRVGVFSSPHILELRECVQIDEVPVSASRLDSELARWRALDPELSDFEALTVAAFSIFQQEQVDVALVECGWGGRRDATHIEGPKNAVVLTHVEEEHLGILGDTVAEIALEKLGIARPGVPLLTVAQSAEVEAVLKNFDAHVIAPVVAGVHPPESVGLALRIASLFGVVGRVEDLEYFQIPGRFEVISWQGRTLILDGAHTMDSVSRLKDLVRSRFGRVTWALHFLKDKHTGLPGLFEGDDVVWISLDDERAGVAPEGWLMFELNQFFDQLPEGVAVFAGSFKLVGGVKTYLRENSAGL
jgi:folylpolyglutamate synthase/dihydropteroate synthase